MRKQITFTLDEKVIYVLKKMSKESFVPQARLVEMAIKKLLKEEMNKNGL